MKTTLIPLLLALSSTPVIASNGPGCASTLSQLRSMMGDLPRTWRETSATTDNDPLILRLGETDGQLTIDLRKSRSGRSLGSGAGTICRRGDSYRARMPGRPAVTLRPLGPETLEVSVLTWSGTFAPN